MKALKNYLKKYYQRLLNISLARYYHSLDKMPIGAFTAAMSGDISRVSSNGRLAPKKALRIWERLFNQHIEKHGLPEAYTDYMSKITKAYECYDDAYNNGKRWMVVKARVYESEAKQLLNVESERIETTCARISKIMGFPITADKCSVTEFHGYVTLITN